ncbi:SPFH domain-containing protein [Roseococcus pinisoli]|uniref:Protein QmcA n=1 Tax=Roseococcus pinisoli TaxID=2835040 RepID=A0ABS5Q8G4_9PROT|nr:SPFH domain-containing protein [Roseococcus pinisoli]MBS7809788.1 SPFH/Band 7/PHB domain protein [Roseococcus pinisoli]
MEFVLLAVVIVAVIAIFQGVRTVPQGHIWTVERFGRFTRTLEPGLNLIIPVIDRVGRRISIQEIVLDIPEQAVITKDNAAVLVDGIVYYRVMDVVKAAYQVANLGAALEALAMTNLRSVIGSMTFDETLSKREEISHQLMAVLDAATDPWGVKVTRVELRKVEPPQNLIEAMNMQMTAERRRRAVVMEADGKREAQVLEARGRMEAAEMDAQARERLARAEALAVEVVAKAAEGAGGAALGYFVADKYMAALKGLASSPNTKTMIVPIEAAGMAGAIGQVMATLSVVGAPGAAPPAVPGSVPTVGPFGPR